MRYLLLILFSLISSNLFSQDLKEIEQHLNFYLKNNASIYRGLKFTIYFEKKDGLCNITTHPNSVLDSSILEEINLEFNKQIKDSELAKLRAYVKFDDYSSDIFINVEDVSGGEELINHRYVPLEPKGGPEAFVSRWYSHLDSCKDLVRHMEGKYLSFYVQKNGELTSLDDSKQSSVLGAFLKAEKKWYPGILNGRVLKYKIGLLIPLQDNGTLVRNSLVKVLQQDECTVWSDDVHVSHKFINREKLNVVSLVLYNGRYVSPIVHQGDLKQCENLIQFIQKQKKQFYFGGYYSEQFDRIYFYTYNN